MLCGYRRRGIGPCSIQNKIKRINPQRPVSNHTHSGTPEQRDPDRRTLRFGETVELTIGGRERLTRCTAGVKVSYGTSYRMGMLPHRERFENKKEEEKTLDLR